MKLTESQMETILENLPPEPGPRLGKRLSSAPWTPRGVRRRQILTVLYVTVMLLAALIGLTPRGRAFAQTIFEFFTTTDQSSIPLAKEDIDRFYTPPAPHALSLMEVTPLPPLADYCANPEEAGTYQCEVQYLEKELNVDLKEFSTTPSDLTFIKAQLFSEVSASVLAAYPSAWTTTYSVVDISYQNADGAIYLRQGIGDFPPDSDWDKVSGSAIEAVEIGNYDGEYVNGSFSLRNGDNQLTWQRGGEQRIRWREEARWFEILEFGSPGTSGYMDKHALVSLAGNMVYQPDPEQIAKISPDFIPNVALAEQICNYDILEPTKLPEAMALDHIKYDPQWKSVTLSYGYRALRIVQTPLETALIRNLDTYQHVETVRVGDVEGQFGVSPAQKTIWDSAIPPAFPVSNTYSDLLWKTDAMVYQIYFDQSFSSGGQLTKEQMIEIAESLQ